MITFIILGILLFGYLLISTERYTNINKAAVAVFIGTVGWVVYISFGSDFVFQQHKEEYFYFLSGNAPNSTLVKYFIAKNIFLGYVAKASEVVLFLLATMTIVEILNNNGCFDFIAALARTRNSRKLLWILSFSTFLISANLDNFTTTVMMLTILRQLLPKRKIRMIYGSVIVIAANVGGVLTVIGSPEGLVLWNMGAISGRNYFLSMLLPCLLVWILSTYWIGRMLPERVDIEYEGLPYRGNDTNLNIWQRVLMLFVGIGGLWFIPIFSNITKLSPFLGALCVLSILWIVNEVCNRRLLNTEEMISRRIPRLLQYGSIQLILFVMGMMLALDVIVETGVLKEITSYIDNEKPDIWIIGVICGTVSVVLDSFATALSFISIHPLLSNININDNYLLNFAGEGIYWKIIAYMSAIGGCVLPISSISGLALISEEKVGLGWYFKNAGWKVMVCGLLGFSILYCTA